MAGMMIEGDKKNVEPELVERELTCSDVKEIELALRTKRGLGWVHAMGLVRRIQELEAEVVGGRDGDRQAGRMPGKRAED